MDNYTCPDFSNSAIITIDLQQDFLDGQPLQIPGTSQILSEVKIVLDLYRRNAKPIIHTIRIYKNDGTNVDLCRRKEFENSMNILLENSQGAELAPQLFDNNRVTNNTKLLLDGGIQKISENEVIIYKPRWGAFYETPLDYYLKNKGINTLVFCGCNFPNCPRTSIYEASERDYKIVLIEDAISGIYKQGITELKNIGVFITNTKNIQNY